MSAGSLSHGQIVKAVGPWRESTAAERANHGRTLGIPQQLALSNILLI